MQNLLSNAVKFTHQGSVGLSIELTEREHHGELTIQVSDTGIGISEDKHSAVFDPFSQAEGDTTRRFGGTGLGLSITRDLVKAMNGTIDLASTIGEGSQFTIVLPVILTDAIDHATQEQELPEFDGSGLWALIAEDTRVNAVVLGKFLANKGFDYEVVENGQLAIEKVQQRHFDCVLMDNHMPEMDGLEATRAITSLNLDNPPIIIGCTADAFEQTRQQMMSEGCAEVITKPVSSAQLDKVFHATLTPNRANSAKQA
ncbi:hypothetical protein GCM10007938_15860 [Vibrio zhanjiangensis]|uniref:histidine kinase n=1 Tax=Vibrio zhanjiangensis TaxID=1046128 RepID=A0ABQ6EX82_9VIBR|nr:hypothetical protein GCM10007938_15860 [Vibrio zhanjiangensis]